MESLKNTITASEIVFIVLLGISFTMWLYGLLRYGSIKASARPEKYNSFQGIAELAAFGAAAISYKNAGFLPPNYYLWTAIFFLISGIYYFWTAIDQGSQNDTPR